MIGLWLLVGAIALLILDRSSPGSVSRRDLLVRQEGSATAEAGLVSELLDVFQPSRKVVQEDRAHRVMRVDQSESAAPYSPEP